MDNFTLALKTIEYTYYIEFEECDENGNTKMYDNEGLLVSDNIHACYSYLDDMIEVIKGDKAALYINPEALENVKMYLDQE